MKELGLFAAASALAMFVAASPAFAGTLPIPSPEAGIGLSAMALIGGGYAYLKRRINRR